MSKWCKCPNWDARTNFKDGTTIFPKNDHYFHMKKKMKISKRKKRKRWRGITSVSIQLLSHVQLFSTQWTVACQASLSITNCQNLLKLMSIESVDIQPSHPLYSLLLLASIFPSIRLFSSESVLCIRWQRKYWSFSLSISPSNEHSGLISFMIDWLDLLAVQGTLKSLLQHHSSKASILQHSAFFIVQFSHPYMTTGKTIAFTRRNFVGKITSLLFSMLSRLVITFLSRSKCVLISTRPLRHREMRAIFSCMAWRAVPSPLSKLHRRLDSL